jgi:hypothetical protein
MNLSRAAGGWRLWDIMKLRDKWGGNKTENRQQKQQLAVSREQLTINHWNKGENVWIRQRGVW